MSEKKIFAIINPISGTSKKDNLDKKIMKMLSGNEVTIDIAYTEYSGHATLLAKEAVDKGYLTGVLSTNLTYRRPELLAAPWYYEVDCSKYIALYIASLNHDISVRELLDPLQKINALVAKHKAAQA